jgi:hypothetical protein
MPVGSVAQGFIPVRTGCRKPGTDLEIGYSLLDIAHSYFSEYQIINTHCSMIKYSNDKMQHAGW